MGPEVEVRLALAFLPGITAEECRAEARAMRRCAADADAEREAATGAVARHEAAGLPVSA